MGAAADAAKGNSKFLKLEKGETVVVEFLSYEIIPSNLDPDKKQIQCKLRWRDDVKYWNSGNSDIMMFFDELPKGSLVEIKRDIWIDREGKEDPKKSAWKVRLAPQS